jgi:hypothetical protein
VAEITKEQFLNEYSRALDDGNAALFAGAGTSAASGMVDWRGLLREIAGGLGLDVDEESDLIGVAQYEHNNTGNRHRLNTAIVDEFNKRATPSSSHKWLAHLPIETVWTTNYDKLIENAFEAVDKRVEVKHSTSQLTVKVRNSDVTIYKMHGDVSDPDHAVLTKDDYERYEVDRQAFTEILRTDLTRCCFLFLGFSFTDPNIEYIFSRLRQMLKGANRIHYCIMRRPQKPTDPALVEKYNRDLARFRHRVIDLKRFGIQTLAIDAFSEIDPLLRTLVYRTATKNVLVSGSADDASAFGKARLDSLARRVGKELISRGYNLVSGYGLGIGGACILGANEVAYFNKNTRPGQHLFLRLFPQEILAGVRRSELYTRIRKEMVEQSGAVIFLAGNKRDASGAVVLADGVLEEYNLAKAESKVLIPVACTGYAAERIWREIEPQLGSLFPKVNVQAEFNVLGDQSSSEDHLVEAIFDILKKVQSK